MKILLFGAARMVGSRIAAEALRRGHELTAVTRSGGGPSLVDPKLTVVAADAADPGKVAELAAGHDVVASALAPPRDGSEPTGPFLAANQALIEGVRAARVRRLTVVGGAGSLQVAPGRDSSTPRASPTCTSPSARPRRSARRVPHGQRP